MGDVEQAGAMHNLLAALHDYLGDTATAWQHRLIALRSAVCFAFAAFQVTGIEQRSAVDSFDSPETALVVQEAALAAARESGREAVIVDVLAQRASLLAALNRASDAEASAARSPRASRPRAGTSGSQPRRSCRARDRKRFAPPRAPGGGGRRQLRSHPTGPTARRAFAHRAAEPEARAGQYRLGTDRRRRASRSTGASRRSTRSARPAPNSGRFPRSTNRGNCSIPRSSCRSRKRITSARSRWPKRRVRDRPAKQRGSRLPASPPCRRRWRR